MPPSSSTFPEVDSRQIEPLQIVVSGPGGVGKGTIVSSLMAVDSQLWLSRSWSTRAPRPGESVDAYHFVSAERFQAHIDDGGFLEWVDFLDYRQGTPIPDPPSGSDVVFEIDVHGGVAIAEQCEDPLLLFVDTPSRAEQRRRLEGRGDPAEKVTARIERGDVERTIARQHGYRTVINDNLEDTVRQIHELIKAARSARVAR